MYKTAVKNKSTASNHSDLYNDVEKIKAAIFKAGAHAKDRAGELWTDSIDGIKDRRDAVQENVTNYVTERPLRSVGFAMLAGMLIGYLMHK